MHKLKKAMSLVVAGFLASCQSPVAVSAKVSPSSSPVSSSTPASESTPVSPSTVSTESTSPSASVSTSTSVMPTVTTRVGFDGVNDLALAQNILYSTPVYGKAISEKFPAKAVDLFHPTFVYDNQGNLSVEKTYAADSTHTWHCVDTYSDIGTTQVPDSFLDNIIFQSPSTPVVPPVLRANTYTYTIDWAANHTINVSGSIVVAGQAVDMTDQIADIKRNDGTLITDWSLKPNNTAYASASGKTFTVTNAANSVRINLMVPDPTDSTKTVAAGPYFTVKAISQNLSAMKEDVKANPFAQNYTAELIKNSDKTVLVRTRHNAHYFVTEDRVAGTKKGILEKGSAVRFTMSDDALTFENHRTYPLSENSAGVACPLDSAVESYLNDAMASDQWKSVASIDITPNSPFYNDYSEGILGVNLADYVTVADAGNFVGITHDATAGTYTLSLAVKAINGSTNTFTDTGYSIVLSNRGTTTDSAVEAYLSGTETPQFLALPTGLPSAFKVLSTQQNFTLQSHTYWTEGETVLSDGATLTGLINCTALPSGDLVAYGDKDIYYAADRVKKYYAGVRKDGKLYEISGVPNPQTGGVLWYRSDVTSVTLEDGTKKDDPDLWSNSNVTLYASLSTLTEANLQNLNVLDSSTITH
jgi:hypothetical protein